MYIKAHVYNTENEALQAIELINKSEGIPVSDDAVTRTYTEPHEHNGIIYIASDDVTAKYLGEPIEIEINTENENI